MPQRRGGNSQAPDRDSPETSTTLKGDSLFDRRSARDLPEAMLALVVGWAAGEVGRIGEVVLVCPEEDSEQTFVFGRGVSKDDNHQRLLLVRQRPSESRLTAPLTNRFISRKQILIQKGEGRSLSVENVGSCKMLINAKEAEKGIIGPGDILNDRS